MFIELYGECVFDDDVKNRVLNGYFTYSKGVKIKFRYAEQVTANNVFVMKLSPSYTIFCQKLPKMRKNGFFILEFGIA